MYVIYSMYANKLVWIGYEVMCNMEPVTLLAAPEDTGSSHMLNEMETPPSRQMLLIWGGG